MVDVLLEEIQELLLTEEQQKWWLRYLDYRRQVAAGDEQRAVRLLAADMLADSPDNSIRVNGRLLYSFDTPTQSMSKAAYIQSVRTERTWGDDATLAFVLNKLGYQPVIHVPKLLPYVPFTQHNYCHRIDVICTGNHWMLMEKNTAGKLVPKSNRGAGNCMYHTLAQQLEKDAPEMQKAVQRKTIPAQTHTQNAAQREVERVWQKATKNPVINEVLDQWLESVKGNPKETFAYLLCYLGAGDITLQEPAHLTLIQNTIHAMDSATAKACYVRARDSETSLAKTSAGTYLAQQLLKQMNAEDRAACSLTATAKTQNLFASSCRTPVEPAVTSDAAAMCTIKV